MRGKGKKRRELHGQSRTNSYMVWQKMIARCERGNCLKPEYYRNVKVCKRWRQSFKAFVRDVGTIPPGYVVHRLDSAGSYEPGNVMVVPKDEHGWIHRKRAAA